MRHIIYVVSAGTQWQVRCDHCSFQNFVTQAEAIRVAKSHVSSLPAGMLSQIKIQNDKGLFRDEWTYGKDPFPPRG